MGMEFSMWRMKMSTMEKLLTSEEACNVFLDTQFPYPDEDPLGNDNNKVKYSVDPEDDGIYLGKSWHILHYLITGNDEGGQSILDLAIMAGHLVEGLGEELFWLSPQEVLDVANALDSLTVKEMKKKGSKDVMSKFTIYKCPPGIEDHEFMELMEDFKTLKEYYKKAAERSNAILRMIG